MKNSPPGKYFTACSTGKADAVAAFLADGVDPNARDKYQLTGLMWAGRKGHVDVAKILLDRGADIDAGDVRNRTALFHAVTYKRYAFVDFMVERGANLDPVDTHGWSPLDFARCNHNKKMEALLVRLGAQAQVYKEA